jgi:hypothetical protein
MLLVETTTVSRFRLPQTVTYWLQSATDGNGDASYSAGVAVKARWKTMDGIFTDENGDDHKITNVVYSETLIPKRSMVALEDLDGQATPSDNSREVLNVIDNPSMNTLNKMVL